MNNNALDDIKKSLNTIRTQTELADAETQLEVLELILSTSISVVALAKKVSAVQPKPQKSKPAVKAPAPKPLSVPPQANQSVTTSNIEPTPKLQKTIRPLPPLPNQQSD